MSEISIDAGTIVRAVMDASPATIAVFVRRRMHCPGCVMSAFVTVGEAASTYSVGTDELIAELRETVSNADAGAPP